MQDLARRTEAGKRSMVEHMQSKNGRDGWWDYRHTWSSWEEEHRQMSEDEKKAAVESLAERCVVLDNLAPRVDPLTVTSALGQFGLVLGVKMFINPVTNKFVGAAIAEMGSKEQSQQVVRELRDFLFMVGAMPRPARAIAASPLHLLDHPWRRNPNMVKPRLVRKSDPGGEILREREHKCRIHADDGEHLLRFMEQEEIKLAKLQEISCQEAMEKLAMIAKEQKAGTLDKVKRLHGMNY